jgi:hypothetical protein
MKLVFQLIGDSTKGNSLKRCETSSDFISAIEILWRFPAFRGELEQHEEKENENRQRVDRTHI